jgi:4-amino-4-deoxy-L-arabinose transferase-like glycosyltransferase
MTGMRRTGRELVGRARRTILADLRSDPVLRYTLLLAAALTTFWFWHRLPNFATRDEQARLFDPMVAVGTFLADPSLDSLKAGVAWGRVPFGATFYLFALALLPVVIVAAIVGQLDAFLAFQPGALEYGYWDVWRETPAWIWTVSLALVRLFEAAFAVGCVYLTYRIGLELRDRATGRLAALFLTFTFGLLTIAHEGGEDVPALFFTLLALYLLVVYVRTGEAAPFLVASAAGGLAMAFKLTAAPVVAVVAAAFLLRAHRAGPDVGSAWQATRRQAWLVPVGAALGLAAMLVGFPTLLVGNVDFVYQRVFVYSLNRTTHPTGPDAPVWWWFTKQYFNAFGLPLFLGTVGGLAATVARFRDRRRNRHATALLLVTLGLFVFMFSRWHDFRTHHLLPTFPPLVLLLAAALVRFRERSPGAANVVIALLLVSGGLYAGAGVLSYADAPRDDAVA